MTIYRTILVPTDFSPASDAALKTALDLSRHLDGAAIHVVHVWQLPVYTVPDGYFMLGAEATGRLVEGLEKSLAELKTRYAQRDGQTIHTHLAEGTPETEIHRLANELGATLIVMGTHGRTGIAHALLGSIAEKVVRHAKVPVVVVPPVPH